MPRTRKGSARRKKHKEILKAVRGHIGAASRRYRVAKQAYIRAGQHARIGRKLRKRDFRRLWITRISAACRQRGLTYSRFIHALNERGIEVNRKMLAEIAVSDPAAFDKIVATATSEAPAATAAATEVETVVAEQPQTHAATTESQAAQAVEASTTQAPQDESAEQEKSVEQAEQAEQEQEKAKKTTTKTTKKAVKKTAKKTTAKKSTKKTTTKKKATTKKTTKKTTTGKTRKKSTTKTTRKKKEE